MEKKNLSVVWAALVLVQLGFGAYGVVVTKFAKNAHADPLIFCAIRDGGAFPVLMLAALVLEGRLTIPSVKEVPVLMLLGFLGMFAGQLMYILGLYYTSADVASIFQPMTPVWTTIGAAIARVEPLPSLRRSQGRMKILGIILAATGAVIMTTNRNTPATRRSDDGGSTQQLKGYGALIMGTMIVSGYVIIQKKFVFNNPTCRLSKSPVSLTAWSYFFGFIYMSMTSLCVVRQPEKFTIPSKSIFPLIYAVFITSAMCYVLLSWCNMQINASAVTASWPLQVLFCVVLAYFVLGETLILAQVLGAVLIIGGLLAVLWSNHQDEQESGADAAGQLRAQDSTLLLQTESSV